MATGYINIEFDNIADFIKCSGAKRVFRSKHTGTSFDEIWFVENTGTTPVLYRLTTQAANIDQWIADEDDEDDIGYGKFGDNIVEAEFHWRTE